MHRFKAVHVLTRIMCVLTRLVYCTVLQVCADARVPARSVRERCGAHLLPRERRAAEGVDRVPHPMGTSRAHSLSFSFSLSLSLSSALARPLIHTRPWPPWHEHTHSRTYKQMYKPHVCRYALSPSLSLSLSLSLSIRGVVLKPCIMRRLPHTVHTIGTQAQIEHLKTPGQWITKHPNEKGPSLQPLDLDVAVAAAVVAVVVVVVVAVVAVLAAAMRVHCEVSSFSSSVCFRLSMASLKHIGRPSRPEHALIWVLQARSNSCLPASNSTASTDAAPSHRTGMVNSKHC